MSTCFATLRRLALFPLLALALVASAHGQDDAANARRDGVAAIYPIMLKAVEAGDLAQARTLCEHVILMEPQNPVHRYNLACIESRAGGPMLPRAIAALEQAVQLGFNDLEGLRNDADLAAIRGDPKFAVLVRTVAARVGQNAEESDAAQSPEPTPAVAASERAPAPIRASAPSAAPAKSAARSAADTTAALPAAATLKGRMPVGLYFMTRFWPATGSLEKSVWYFSPDGTVYEDLEFGFSAEDLTAHAGKKGTATVNGDALDVSWTKGRKTSSTLTPSGKGFSWNGGIFTAVKPFDGNSIAGVYEGGESLSGAGGRAIVSKRLELRADGTFTWNGVSFLGSTTRDSKVWAGATGGSSGTWKIVGQSIVMVDEAGNVFRRIAFQYDDESTPLKPDRIFIGGIMYKRQAP